MWRKNPASQEIGVCLPTQNEVSSTFLHGFANAHSAVNQITAVQVHIDNNLVYNDTSGATHVDGAFTVAKGPHSVVKAGTRAAMTAPSPRLPAEAVHRMRHPAMISRAWLSHAISGLG